MISLSGAAVDASGRAIPSDFSIDSAMIFGSGRTISTMTAETKSSPAAPAQGRRSEAPDTSRPRNIGAKTVGPRIAPKTAPNMM
jgi:hypothetical protein